VAAIWVKLKISKTSVNLMIRRQLGRHQHNRQVDGTSPILVKQGGAHLEGTICQSSSEVRKTPLKGAKELEPVSDFYGSTMGQKKTTANTVAFRLQLANTDKPDEKQETWPNILHRQGSQRKVKL